MELIPTWEGPQEWRHNCLHGKIKQEKDSSEVSTSLGLEGVSWSCAGLALDFQCQGRRKLSKMPL